MQALERGNAELELSKDKEIRQLIENYESDLKKRDTQINEMNEKMEKPRLPPLENFSSMHST